MKVKLRLSNQKNADYYHASVGNVVQIELNDYLWGVVAAQMGNAPMQALKAQAVACRTTAYPYYSKGKEISDSGSVIQAFNATRMSDTYSDACVAVALTDGELVCYQGKPVSPCSFSSSNGGKTTSSEQRWGGYRAWLIQKDDPWDNGNGKGHGVGLSQTGAKNMANAGKDYKAILTFYYDKTTVETIEQEVMQMQVSVDKFLEQANYIRDHFNSKTKYQNGMSGQLVDGYYRTDCRSWACSLDTPQMRIFFQLHRHKLYEPQTNRGVYIS